MRDRNKDNLLMIFLQNGCSIMKEHEAKFCNFLLEINEDEKASSDVKSKADEQFERLECNKEAACDYCYVKPPSGPPPPGPPPSGPPPCENTRPASCPKKTKQLHQQEEIVQTINNRRKRMIEHEHAEDPITKVDFDTDASFTKMMMEIPSEYRFLIQTEKSQHHT